MAKYCLLGATIGLGVILIRKLIKELKYLDHVAKETANMQIRMEILYSKLMDKLVTEGLNDRARLIAIWDCLSGYRPATV